MVNAIDVRDAHECLIVVAITNIVQLITGEGSVTSFYPGTTSGLFAYNVCMYACA